MSEREVAERLRALPVDETAGERTWEVVEAAFAARQPRPAPHEGRLRAGLLAAAAVAALVAAVLSPPGRAVVDAVRRSIGIAHAEPALFRLPAPGRLLVSGSGGAWVVAADGSRRLLGDYPQASWSPHGRFVVGATSDELATIEPGTGRVHWSLARPQVRFPRWGGTRTDTRIAYLTTSRLHVVGGDGVGDAAVEGLPAAARVAPAWQPRTDGRHVLAYVTAAGRVIVLDAGPDSIAWASPGYAGSVALAWSPDGRRLALATHTQVVLFDGRTGRARVLHVAAVHALAFARGGRLALLRRRSVLVTAGGRVATLFSAPGPLAGLAWSPDGRWLATALPGADQWIFLGRGRVLAVSHVSRQFGGAESLDGWARGA